MKPIIIIAIAVTCSVIAVFAVILAIVAHDEYQYQQAVKDVQQRQVETEAYQDKTFKTFSSYCHDNYYGQLLEFNKCMDMARDAASRADPFAEIATVTQELTTDYCISEYSIGSKMYVLCMKAVENPNQGALKYP